MNTSRTTLTTLAHTLLAAVLIAGLTVAAAQPDGEPAGLTGMATRPHAAGSPVGLVEANHCWTGEQPAGVEAGRVVATLPGHDRAGIYGPRITRLAIEQVVFGVDHGIPAIYGFCR